MDSDHATFSRRPRPSRRLVCAAFTVATAIALALPVAAPARSWSVSERTVRALETSILGQAHAREHALERRAEKRARERWRSMSRERRARIRRRARVLVHAASLLPPSEAGSWDAPFPLPVHAIHAAVLPTGKVMIWSYPFQATSTSARLLETHAYLWDPSLGTGSDSFHEIDPPADAHSPHAMIFCGGGSLLADGVS
jgi:hypothetical protein